MGFIFFIIVSQRDILYLFILLSSQATDIISKNEHPHIILTNCRRIGYLCFSTSDIGYFHIMFFSFEGSILKFDIFCNMHEIDMETSCQSSKYG